MALTDFWRCWHISLINWFREYVYIPLGGNQKDPWKKALFVTITFFFSGLWYGAGRTFVIWGLLQALYLNLETLRPHRNGQPSPQSHFASLCAGPFVRLWTFALCCFSWVFFRASSMRDALYILRHSITGGKAPVKYTGTLWLDYSGDAAFSRRYDLFADIDLLNQVGAKLFNEQFYADA